MQEDKAAYGKRVRYSAVVGTCKEESRDSSEAGVSYTYLYDTAYLYTHTHGHSCCLHMKEGASHPDQGAHVFQARLVDMAVARQHEPHGARDI